MNCFVRLVFCKQTATTEIYTNGRTLSRHDAHPIWDRVGDDRLPLPRPVARRLAGRRERDARRGAAAAAAGRARPHRAAVPVAGDGHVKQSKPIPIPAFPLKGKGQKGVALLTVLLLVAVMSVLVMGMLDEDRKRVVEGKSVSVRVKLGGGRIIK